MNRPWQSSIRDIEDVLRSAPPDRQFHYPIRHGSMRAGLYAPRDSDLQEPHGQDELYIVARGAARFRRDQTWAQVAEGDVLFVPAGMEHCFADFTEDFATWVIFWGPHGGESADSIS